MNVELIPVIEIGYNNQNVPVPTNRPYWKYPDDWNAFHSESHLKAGFPDPLMPYFPGSSFYRIGDITDKNLSKIVIDHMSGHREGLPKNEDTCPLSGGYILNIDGNDVYFPQCCGDLSDITYWENLLKDDTSIFYNGHPEPVIEKTITHIIFDFKTDEFDEQFVPPPPFLIVNVDKTALERAIENVKILLGAFGQRLTKINNEEDLTIQNIENLLIWDND